MTGISKVLVVPGLFLVSTAFGIDIQFQDKAFRRIQSIAEDDMALIAENEAKLDVHVHEWYEIVARVQQVLDATPAAPLALNNKAPTSINAVAVEKKDSTKASSTSSARAEMKELESQMAAQHAKTDSVKAALDSVMGPAMMVPVLEEMYGKFKSDIKRATKQEQKAKDRVVEQQAQFTQWKKEGKTYLLKDKQRVIDYYKKQREIQHRHYHAMLKMAHSMMERIKMVKGMCGKASKGESLSEKEKQELAMMAPNAGK